MIINHDEQRIYVRQSWLGDMMICMERGRLAEVKPEFKTGSDATIMGTSVHYGIEEVLSGKTEPDKIAEASAYRLGQLMSEGGWKHVNIKPDDMVPLTAAMSDTWVKDLMPQVPLGGRIEQNFAVPTGRSVQIDSQTKCTNCGSLEQLTTLHQTDSCGIGKPQHVNTRSLRNRSNQSKRLCMLSL